MLLISIILSLVLLAIANNCALHREKSLVPFFVCGLGFAAVPLALGLFLPPVAMLFGFLLVALLVWYGYGRPRWLFPLLSCAAIVAAFGISGWLAWQEQLEFSRMQDELPYESMEERLPVKTTVRREPLPEATVERLADLEGWIRAQGSWSIGREIMLRRLHEESLQMFISSPGFGVSRMLHRPSADRLKHGVRPEDPIPQPEPRTAPSVAPSESLRGESWERKTPNDDLYRLHQNGVVDYVNPRNFGFFKDRRHVAGFQAHQMSRVPEMAERWALQRVDLVGLLLHEKPVAYVSANLPRMRELREAPTRSLDGFESAGLEELYRGEDLVVGQTSTHMRVLGSIRSTEQCLQCHEGKRGDLLGAFSYLLRLRNPE